MKKAIYDFMHWIARFKALEYLGFFVFFGAMFGVVKLIHMLCLLIFLPKVAPYVAVPAGLVLFFYIVNKLEKLYKEGP